MKFSRRDLLGVAAASPALTLPSAYVPAFAQADYPNKEIRSICALAAGSSTDIFVRYFTGKLSPLAGKPVIVENRVDASGLIGTETAARARPDGYTIFIGSGSSMLAASPHLFKSMPFNPINDFEHITTLARLAFVLIVDAKRPINSVAELTAYVRAKKDKATYGATGAPGTVSAELYKRGANLPDVLQVNYKNTAEILTDLVAGEIDFAFVSSATALAQARAGRIRALAMTAPQRMAVTPDWPSLIEAGVPGVDLMEWWSVHVPAKTPKAIVDKLEGWFNQIVAMEETKTFLNNLGSDPMPGSQASVRALLEKDTKVWGDYVALAKIERL
jgi:tripartite-type tricarboxylate transporter receptor subunit TctC